MNSTKQELGTCKLKHRFGAVYHGNPHKKRDTCIDWRPLVQQTPAAPKPAPPEGEESHPARELWEFVEVRGKPGQANLFYRGAYEGQLCTEIAKAICRRMNEPTDAPDWAEKALEAAREIERECIEADDSAIRFEVSRAAAIIDAALRSYVPAVTARSPCSKCGTPMSTVSIVQVCPKCCRPKDETRTDVPAVTSKAPISAEQDARHFLYSQVRKDLPSYYNRYGDDYSVIKWGDHSHRSFDPLVLTRTVTFGDIANWMEAYASRVLEETQPETLYCDECEKELQREACSHVRECFHCIAPLRRELHEKSQTVEALKNELSQARVDIAAMESNMEAYDILDKKFRNAESELREANAKVEQLIGDQHAISEDYKNAQAELQALRAKQEEEK